MSIVSEAVPGLVLVVDDDDTMRMLLRESMEVAGFRVEEAVSGAQALEVFARIQPDILLMDVEMPEMDGFDACAALRRLPGGERVPVLMVTGLDDTASIERAYEVGATDFIVKPINWVVLGHRVRYMLRGSMTVEALHRSQARLANAQRIAALGDWKWDVSSDRVDLSEQALEVLGLSSAHSGLGLGEVLSRVHDDDHHRVRAAFGKAAAGHGGLSLDHRVVLSDGAERWVHTDGELGVASPGAGVHLVGTVQNVTRRRRTEAALKQSEHRAKVVVDSAPLILLATDPDGVITLFEGASATALAAAPAELLGRSAHGVFREYPDVTEQIARALAGHSPSQTTRIGRTTFETRYRPLRAESGEVIGVTAVWFDVTERVLAEERIRHLAQYDGLTGMPNRELFQDRLQQALARAQRSGCRMALLYLDLDRFKGINDTLSHVVGDQLLVYVGERLRACLPQADTIARQGGDEFIVIIEEVNSEAQCAELAGDVLERIAGAFDIEGHEIFVTASLGIMIHAPGEDSSSLLQCAELAMYRAKELGKNQSHFYTEDMNARAHQRLRTENDLRRALERGEFELYYQPQLDVSSGKIVGVEALIRWNHPRRGVVSPAEFVPILEETGMIVAVGQWVLEEACRQNRAWQTAGTHPVTVAVNLSSRQFIQGQLKEVIVRALRKSGLAPHHLDLEITESVLMHNPDSAAVILEDLHAMGVGVSIDDFGTGYSSLEYLKRFPVDKLKIDRSFVKDLMEDSDDQAITTAIIMMAQSLRLRVVAEGVETPEQLGFLEQRRCDIFQGYLFSPPRPAREIGEMLRAQRRAPADDAAAQGSAGTG